MFEKMFCWLQDHDWSDWEKRVVNGWDYKYIRTCKVCGVVATKPWAKWEIEQYEETNAKAQKEYWEKQEKERQEHLKALNEAKVLDRRGEQIFANSHIWYEGKEHIVYDFNYYSGYGGNLQLYPLSLLGKAVNTGYGVVSVPSSGVVVVK